MRINILGIILIILVLAVIFGKASFWHIVFFPFYAIAGLFGLILGIILIALILVGIAFILFKIFD